MDVTLPRVIALWGAGNGVLLAILVGYGESVFATSLYASVVALLEVVALGAWWTAARQPGDAPVTPAPRAGHLAFVAACGAAFVAVGYSYNAWMMLGAVYPAMAVAVYALRRLLPSPAPVLAEPPAAPPSPNAVHVVAEAGVGAAVAATGIVALVRRLRRR